MAYFEKEGLKMHYEVYPGLAPVDTLFMHGNLASNTWWEPTIEAWKKALGDKKESGSLIFAEWRGNGKSSGPNSEKDLDPAVLAQDYVDLLKHLGVTKANVVGHSTGGLFAMIAMRRAPELFQRCLLLDSVAADGTELAPELVAGMMEMFRNKDLCATIMGSTIHGNDPQNPLFQRIVDDAYNINPMNRKGVLDALGKVRFSSELKHIMQPTLILHGDKDPILPIDNAIQLAKLLPNSKFEMLNNQGHSCNVENPARFVEIARAFLFG